MRIFNLWDEEKGEGQQCETGPSKTKDSLLLTFIAQSKQITIPSANGSKQQLLFNVKQQHTSLEISQGCTLASFGQEDSWRRASPKEFPKGTARVAAQVPEPCVLCPEWLEIGEEFAHSHTVLHSGVKWNSKPSEG